MDITIETIYRARIDYWFDDNFSSDISKAEKVLLYAERLERKYPQLKISNSIGGPAWVSYITIESTDKSQVIKYVNSVCSYIKKFKGYHIE